MSQTNKPGGHLIITLLLLLACTAPSAFGQTRRFTGRKEYLPYTRNLPTVDRVELLKLSLVDEQRVVGIMATKVLKGAEAQRVASLWRRQTYTLSEAACHNPGYAIKFYYQGKLLAYATICWSCNNILMITPGMTRTQSFRGYDRKGEQLSDLFYFAFNEAR